jgi:hypothetical protein
VALTLLSWYVSPPAVALIEAVSNECIGMAAIGWRTRTA